ncbi:methyltransferase [Rhizobium sp. EC-SD404]|uniref:tRNA1(Val) (adenine(37)-N6)-methyltransferase n=1 Tax=Rhizobium sp. EC-SD404 TaxID=2038389 RepID=UPI0012531AC7|nr:methyltransferase [Rhizobium sp. EC-SD404]VVT27403.1 Methyltransferase [Rhizobium sp. EC-SD404]
MTGSSAREDDQFAETIDAFHRGGFALVQPKGRGHRAGMDAMLLAAMVPGSAKGHLADLGAGAGAAGLAAASRVGALRVTLFERSAMMADFARRSLILEQNRHLEDRVDIVEADVTLTGRARVAVGLKDDAFEHVIMNPPFNPEADRQTPDRIKAEAHAMPTGLFENWIRTACAIAKPGGQLSLIARPVSIGDIIAACGRRFGGLQITPVHPRVGEPAIRILVTAIKGSRASLILRSPLVMHEGESHAFSPAVDALNNGLCDYPR